MGRLHSALSQFVSQVGATVDAALDPRQTALAVRRLLRVAIANDDFVLDCIERVVCEMPRMLAGWTNPPIVEDETHLVSLRLMYWPPFSANAPHEHTFWTVTGVLWNELLFMTYAPKNEGEDDLKAARRFLGSRGEVGSVAPPCIHNVSNPTNKPALSLHVFYGPRDEIHDRDGRHSYGRGRTVWHENNPEGIQRQVVQVRDVFEPLICLLTMATGERSCVLLDLLSNRADIAWCLECVKAMAGKDPYSAGSRLVKLAEICGGEDQQRLRCIAQRLLMAKNVR
jgi:predicted metal-dependent enzyme (double-stranded beta helix superfamily)